MLVVLLEDALTVAEQTLMEYGRAAEVVKGRRSLAVIAEPELRRIAEAAANRPVRAVLAQSHLEPDLTTLVFVYEDGSIGRQVGRTMQRSIDETTAARALLAESTQTRRHSAEQRAGRKALRRDAPPDAG